MEGLTSALAVELAPVRVNIVSPGVVKTPLWREMTGSARDALYAAEAQRLLSDMWANRRRSQRDIFI